MHQNKFNSGLKKFKSSFRNGKFLTSLLLAMISYKVVSASIVSMHILYCACFHNHIHVYSGRSFRIVNFVTAIPTIKRNRHYRVLIYFIFHFRYISNFLKVCQLQVHMLCKSQVISSGHFFHATVLNINLHINAFACLPCSRSFSTFEVIITPVCCIALC